MNEFLEEVKQDLTDEELAIALDLGILQLLRLRIEDLEADFIDAIEERQIQESDSQ